MPFRMTVPRWTCLEYNSSGNAVGQQVVQLGAHLKDPRRSVLADDVVGDLSNESLPIWRWDGSLLIDLLTEVGYQHEPALRHEARRILTSARGRLRT